MREIETFEYGFYEATPDGLDFKGSDYQPLFFDDIDILTPDEFIEAYYNIQLNQRIGAWFGKDDLYMLLSL